MDEPERDIFCNIEISDDDVYDAMKDIQGYLDITAQDFRELYRIALKHAVERVANHARAGEIMTSPVTTVKPSTPLRTVADILSLKGVSGVPVIDEENRVVGVISEKDFLSQMSGERTGSFMKIIAKCLHGKGCVAISIRPRKAGDIMSVPAVTVSADATVREIADILTTRKINRVPVVDGKGTLMGIVSRADLVRATSRA